MRVPGIVHGITHRLYQAAREKQRKPLTYLAGSKLVQAVKKGDYVFITEGAGLLPQLPKGETDGPLGAVGVARALSLGLGARPVLITEDSYVEPLIAAAKAAKLSIGRKKSRELGSCILTTYPYDDDGAREAADRLVDEFSPSAMIAIEKLGPNSKGVIHSVNGTDLSEYQAKIHHLFEKARKKSIPTVGIGDGGNEIGFGLIHDQARKIHPFGSRCQCPCKSGATTVAKTDILVVAAISNWGAYGVEASIALLLNKFNILHDVKMEKHMLDMCVRAGGLDGLYARPIRYVDGVPSSTNSSFLRMLQTIVSNSMKHFERSF